MALRRVLLYGPRGALFVLALKLDWVGPKSLRQSRDLTRSPRAQVKFDGVVTDAEKILEQLRASGFDGIHKTHTLNPETRHPKP